MFIFLAGSISREEFELALFQRSHNLSEAYLQDTIGLVQWFLKRKLEEAGTRLGVELPMEDQVGMSTAKTVKRKFDRGSMREVWFVHSCG